MPIPKPSGAETEDQFIGRCMEVLNEDYPDEEQRAAVCYRAWRDETKQSLTKSLDDIIAKAKKREDTFAFEMSAEDARFLERLQKLARPATEKRTKLKRYGLTGAKNYREVLADLIGKNRLKSVVDFILGKKDDYTRLFNKLAPGDSRILVPTLDDVIPDKKAVLAKLKERGYGISDNLRDQLRASLDKVVREFKQTGAPAYHRGIGNKKGKISPTLLQKIDSRLRDTFDSFTRPDPKTGVPPSVKNMATTVTREALNEAHLDYARRVKQDNLGIVSFRKTWKHNPRLSKNPRITHAKINGVTIDMEALFKVPREGGGHDLMDRPHDAYAPDDQKINCNCDLIISVVKQKS